MENVYSDELIEAAVLIADATKDFVEKIIDAFENLSIMFQELVEEIKEVLGLPNRPKYKFVKILSKCIKIDKRRIWFVWHKARSNC